MKTMQQVHNDVRFPPNWTQRIMTPRKPPKSSNVLKASQ